MVRAQAVRPLATPPRLVALPTRRRVRAGSLADAVLRFWDPEDLVQFKLALIAVVFLAGGLLHP